MTDVRRDHNKITVFAINQGEFPVISIFKIHFARHFNLFEHLENLIALEVVGQVFHAKIRPIVVTAYLMPMNSE